MDRRGALGAGQQHFRDLVPAEDDAEQVSDQRHEDQVGERSLDEVGDHDRDLPAEEGEQDRDPE